MEDPDQIALAEIRRGNPRRFGEIVDRHKDRAMTLAVRLLHERREAEEAVQDAFLKAFRSLDRFRGDAAFGTWFYKILYNVCLSRLRRAAPLTVEFDEAGEQLPADEDPAVDELVGQADMRDLLAGEMSRLPAHFRTALTLFYVQEMRYEEIAATMDIPLGSVKTYLFRGKQHLRRLLQHRLRSEVRVV